MAKSVKDDYYSILNCNPSATYEELKESYQKLVRICHPDKLSDENHSTESFIKIDKAWKILKDQQLRKEYDASLLQNNMNEHSLIYDEVNKNNLLFVNDETKYLCRCGNDIVILKEYINEEECIVECSECSNCIVIK